MARLCGCHSIDFSRLRCGLHFWLDGQQTRQLGVAGVIFTIFSATLHWHMIRNGALLVGAESESFSSDLKRIPILIGTYFASPAVWVWSWMNAAFTAEKAEESAAA